MIRYLPKSGKETANTGRTNTARRKGEEGWTFIETIIVLAIVLTLSTTVGFMGFRYIATAKKAASRNQIEALNLALNAYLFDCGRYPAQDQGLKALFTKPASSPIPDSWNGPYLEKPLEKDPWGNPYQYKVPGPDGLPYGIVSYGADGAEGGEGEDADIASWSN
ncbi:type II secretion system major pseudopilin GspG [Marispirochaeta aestuarii]|uniref:type II secretion system major pseudopilin GspG n=1 Tax=Marispirochaeta aestuarii TaxID=1963862 RepID=UPI002ABD7653|nr:type II secretion system major pseudopilin GspG [Marispirochaeta aestuarii]